MGVRVWVLAIALAASTARAQTVPAQAAAILEKHCVQCHSEKMAMSGLRLSGREPILEGGKRGPAVKPGHPDDSLLFQAVAHVGKLTMPPGGKLDPADIGILRNWIEQGAEWPAGGVSTLAPKRSDWWAFRQPKRPAIPSIPSAATPVDAFILEKLRAAGITPAPEADRLALIRRASFDLHGLPPTAEQVRAFLSDQSPNAWENLIDSLLASPRYGEKWGRNWLDLVRYADTAGFEQDPYTLEAWRYRDYVIKSFNDDKPYDRF